MGAFQERLGIERPILQAGMGGGLSGHRLAAAVSEAGGRGTIGFVGPDEMRGELDAARRQTDKPIAANLLLPFATSAHWRAASAADVVVTFWGRPRRRADSLWIHQCGSVAEALEARAAGADAVIAQGHEAGGHVRGELSALELLAAVRSAMLAGYPVLSAGGVADAADVGERIGAGADAVVCGTRFLLSDESGAHPRYKDILLGAEETVVTDLFGLGWPAPHRVVPNAATERWLGESGREPGWLRLLQRVTGPALSRTPAGMQVRLAATQRPGLPIFGPAAATGDGADNLVEAGPLYAGECVARIHELRPAGELVRALAARL